MRVTLCLSELFRHEQGEEQIEEQEYFDYAYDPVLRGSLLEEFLESFHKERENPHSRESDCSI